MAFLSLFLNFAEYCIQQGRLSLKMNRYNTIMTRDEIKKNLADQLKKECCFWSFNNVDFKEIPDDVFIEKVLVYLDLNDIDMLFSLYPYKMVKKVWLNYLVPQHDYYHTLNRFLAWWYFGIKRPDSYLKAMNTRHLHQLLK